MNTQRKAWTFPGRMPGSLREAREKQFFFRKKNQKTTANPELGRRPSQRPSCRFENVFLLLFLQNKKRLT
jgi:hypothetical protein